MSSSGGTERFADVRHHVPFLARHEGVAAVVERLLCYPEIRLAFASAAGEDNPFAAVARHFGLAIRMEGLVERIPSTGPVVVVANHGYGGADALALMAAMCELREDFRVLANREVLLLGGIGSKIIPVSLLDQGKRGGNPAGLRTTLRHVKAGGALGVFPAGRVAFWQGDRMKDPPWNDHVVKLLQRMEATLVPLWFFGSPPPWINLCSRLSGLVRTALIPTGLAKMRGREIVARAGDPIDGLELRERGKAAGPWLRQELEFLADKGN